MRNRIAEIKLLVKLAGYTAVDLAGTYAVDHGPSFEEFKNDLRLAASANFPSAYSADELIEEARTQGDFAYWPCIYWSEGDSSSSP